MASYSSGSCTKVGTSSTVMTATNKSGPSSFENSWMHRRNQLDICPDLLHKPNFRTIWQSPDTSPSYGHSCCYVLTWKEVDSQSVVTASPFYGFWTLPMRLGNSHDGMCDYLITKLTSFSELEKSTKQPTNDRDSRSMEYKISQFMEILPSWQLNKTTLSPQRDREILGR